MKLGDIREHLLSIRQWNRSKADVYDRTAAREYRPCVLLRRRVIRNYGPFASASSMKSLALSLSRRCTCVSCTRVPKNEPVWNSTFTTFCSTKSLVSGILCKTRPSLPQRNFTKNEIKWVLSWSRIVLTHASTPGGHLRPYELIIRVVCFSSLEKQVLVWDFWPF